MGQQLRVGPPTWHPKLIFEFVTGRSMKPNVRRYAAEMPVCISQPGMDWQRLLKMGRQQDRRHVQLLLALLQWAKEPVLLGNVAKAMNDLLDLYGGDYDTIIPMVTMYGGDKALLDSKLKQATSTNRRC